jgi:hypothetical protein
MAHVTLLEILKAWIQVLWEQRPEVLKKSYWVGYHDDTHYQDECYMCNLSGESCPTCPFRAFIEPEEKAKGRLNVY